MKNQLKPIRFTGTLEKSDNKLWGAHIVVPASIARKLIGGTSRRVIRTLNGLKEHQCALLPFGKGSHVLSVNKKWYDTLKLEIGAKVEVCLRKDESKYGLPVPDELTELLRQDKDGHRLFHSLTAGKQRTLLYIIGSSTDPDVRAWKAITIIRHLRANAGTVNYKQLSKALQHRRIRREELSL